MICLPTPSNGTLTLRAYCGTLDAAEDENGTASFRDAARETAIVLTAFGTATDASATYAFIEKYFRRHFPSCAIVWAFTSQRLRRVMSARGVQWRSPAETLTDLHRRGYRRAVVQSLHIVPGQEYEKAVAAAATAPLPTAVGLPLLACADDCRRTVGALRDLMPPADDRAVVLAGHGTRHPVGAAQYKAFTDCLREHCGPAVHLCMVEGEPRWSTVHAALCARGIRSVLFIPFMLVAGEHIMRDVLGAAAESWRSSLDGIAVEALPRGIGFNEKILAVYADHLRAALHA